MKPVRTAEELNIAGDEAKLCNAEIMCEAAIVAMGERMVVSTSENSLAAMRALLDAREFLLKDFKLRESRL